MGCPGCYSLDCYCDNPGDDPRHEWDEFPHQWTDEFGSRCRAKARKAGWLIDERKHKFLCPKCNPKSKHYQPPQGPLWKNEDRARIG
jgi:hypothetical protein